MTPRLSFGLVFVLAAGMLAAAPPQDSPPARTHYKGREIARTMHFTGAPWLVRESREREEECSTLLRELGVRQGDAVCDLGCGNGFYTLPLAELVGPAGRVLAVEVQQQMLTLLNQRAKSTEVADRIETILGELWDPKLPPGELDLVLLVDVYHELSHPELVLRSIRRSLRPGGRMVLAEFREEDPDVPIKPLHKMSKRQILREVVPNGFRLVRQFDGLPWQHLMFFEAVEAGELDDSVRAGLAKATEFIRSIAVHGGYAGIYSLDLQRTYGEALYETAEKGEIWVQPPGTPSVGAVFQRAFELTGDARYFDAARDAGRSLAWGQREAGGWDHRVDVSHLTADADVPTRAKGHCTFDDDISQGALTFLIGLDDLVEEAWLTASIRLGLRHLLESQFENGAWPQWYPLRGGYHDFYTFNDNAINDCIRVALLAHRVYGDEEYLSAALRGGDFIARSRLAKPQAGWAQQYSHDLRPAAARSFEPAAVCSAVTARNIRTLTRLFLLTRDPKFLAPVDDALDWLTKSRLENGEWARFYEIGTNRPIYGDRDGEIHYDLDDVSEERRSGYAWRGSWADGLARDHRRLVALGADDYASRRSIEGENARLQRADTLHRRVREVLDELDGQGRWLRDGRIHVQDFVRGAGVLCDYLALRRR